MLSINYSIKVMSNVCRSEVFIKCQAWLSVTSFKLSATLSVNFCCVFCRIMILGDLHLSCAVLKMSPFERFDSLVSFWSFGILHDSFIVLFISCTVLRQRLTRPRLTHLMKIIEIFQIKKFWRSFVKIPTFGPNSSKWWSI